MSGMESLQDGSEAISEKQNDGALSVESTGSSSLHAKINNSVWQYLKKNDDFSAYVDKLDSDYGIQVDHVISDNSVLLTTSSANGYEERAEEVMSRLRALIADVKVIRLPVQEESVISGVKSNLSNISEGCIIEINEDGSLTVTGTSEQSKKCIDALCGAIGVSQEPIASTSNTKTISLSGQVSSGSSVDFANSRDPTLMLKSPHEPSTDNQSKTGGSNDDDDSSVVVEELLWNWIQKDSTAKGEIDAVLAECGVTVDVKHDESGNEEEELYGTNVKLILTDGDRSNVSEVKGKIKEIVTKYESSLIRKKGTGTDEAFNKIKRLLPIINKSPCLVDARNKIVTVIGRDNDIKEVLPKLSNYGVEFEGMQAEGYKLPAKTTTEPSGGVKPFNSGSAGAGQGNPMSRGFTGQPLRQGMSQFPGSQMMDPRHLGAGYNSSDYDALAVQAMSQSSADGKSASLPVEKILWAYIKRCKSSELSELRDAYRVNVEISGDDSGNMTGHVLVNLAAESEDMLDCGRSAFLQLLEFLQRDIVVALLPVKFGREAEGGSGARESAELRSVFDMIRTECSTEDSLVECSADGIYIVARSHKSQEAQERVANFMKNFAQLVQQGQHGAGGLAGMEPQSIGAFPGQGHVLGGMMTGGRGMSGRVAVSGSGPVIREIPDENDTAVSGEDKPPQPVLKSSTSNADSTTARAERVKSETGGEGMLGLCSACCITPQMGSTGDQNIGNCGHTYCMSCIEMYFGCKGIECPTCGVSDHAGSDSKYTQPADGRMLVNEDASFSLPGFEKTSSGTFVLTYFFPAGTQSDDMPCPGQRYEGTTKTAFLPKNSEGLAVVNLLRKAFDKRIVFTCENEQLMFNGVRHKENIYGGPQKCGYPDPVYLRRVKTDLLSKGVKL